jgi:hypothetical protein
MSDDRPTKGVQAHLERGLGHKLYRDVRSWGKIATLLVLIVVVCGFVLYWILG